MEFLENDEGTENGKCPNDKNIGVNDRESQKIISAIEQQQNRHIE